MLTVAAKAEMGKLAPLALLRYTVRGLIRVVYGVVVSTVGLPRVCRAGINDCLTQLFELGNPFFRRDQDVIGRRAKAPVARAQTKSPTAERLSGLQRKTDPKLS